MLAIAIETLAGRFGMYEYSAFREKLFKRHKFHPFREKEVKWRNLTRVFKTCEVDGNFLRPVLKFSYFIFGLKNVSREKNLQSNDYFLGNP